MSKQKIEEITEFINDRKLSYKQELAELSLLEEPGYEEQGAMSLCMAQIALLDELTSLIQGDE